MEAMLLCMCIGLIGGITGVIALVRVAALRRELDAATARLKQAQPAAATARPVGAAPPPLPVTPAIEAKAPPVAAAMPLPAAAGGGEVGPASAGSLESQIGKQWIAWVGAVVLFLSAVFFLKHAFDNDWIGPTGQVATCALAGAAMLLAGSRFAARGWRMLGQSLIGLGLAVLYATFFAAFSIYSPAILSQTAAFGLMVAVTVAGMALAVLHNGPTIGFLAVLGGLLTPVLVSTGQDARDALFTYLLLLDLGVLGVAMFRPWRLLDTLAMVGTFMLYAGWYGQFYKPAGLGPALAWLGAFYIVFLALPFLYHLLRKQNLTIERFVMALANAAFAAGFAWHTLRGEHLFAMGFVALAMAAAYLVLGAIIRRRLPQDVPALFGTISMAVTFLTLAVPMQLRADGITLAWVAEAPVLAYLAYRFRYQPVRVLAAAVLLLGVCRLFLVHWPMHHGLYTPFLNRQFLSAMAVPAAAAAYALIHHRFRSQASPLDRGLKLSAAIGGGLLAMIVLHTELGGWLADAWGQRPAANVLTVMWAVGSLVYLLAGLRARAAAEWVWTAGTVLLLVAAVRAINAFEESDADGRFLFANGRFLAGLLVALTLFSYAKALGRGGKDARQVAAGFFVAAIGGLLALLSAEVYAYCLDVVADPIAARRTGQMAITVVWGAYATAMLFVGFAARLRPLRLGGLALFGAAAIKLVLVDLTHLRDVYRIVSFMVLGLLMLAASYLYHKLERRLADSPPSPAEARSEK